jgi:hypothetical protein
MFHMQPEIAGVTTTDGNFARAGLEFQASPFRTLAHTEAVAQTPSVVLLNRQTAGENPLAGIFATI